MLAIITVLIWMQRTNKTYNINKQNKTNYHEPSNYVQAKYNHQSELYAYPIKADHLNLYPAFRTPTLEKRKEIKRKCSDIP